MSFDHVALAFIHPHEYSALFGTALWRTVASHPGIEVIDLGSGPMVASARNEVAFTFLERTKAEIILMVDADMAFPPTHVDRIVELVDADESPIVGGLCFVVGRSGILEPTLKVTDPEHGGLKVVWDYPRDTLVSIDATGCAFLAVHRSVFVKLLETYGDQAFPLFADSTHGGIPWGEDVTFCVRARQHGYPVKVHTGIRVGHVKPYIYTEDDYIEQKARIAAVGEDHVKAEHARRMGLVDAAIDPPVVRQLSRRDRRMLARASR